MKAFSLYLLSTVNSVCWAPHDYGLILACGSSDGAISLLTYTGEGQWEVKKINNAHTVSPAPAFFMGERAVALLKSSVLLGGEWVSQLSGGWERV